jgi:hypothetical protein
MTETKETETKETEVKETKIKETEVKNINLELSSLSSKKIPPEKKKEVSTSVKVQKKRVITETKGWTKYLSNTPILEEDTWLDSIREVDKVQEEKESEEEEANKEVQTEDHNKKIHFLRELMRQKINGYKSQDEKKNLYSPEEFVSLNSVIDLLKKSELNCFYCKEKVKIWYEISRDPKQWTLERIDNKYGHNQGNVELACLSCNLKRRTMYHERFVFTKQMKLEKMI